MHCHVAVRKDWFPAQLLRDGLDLLVLGGVRFGAIGMGTRGVDLNKLVHEGFVHILLIL